MEQRLVCVCSNELISVFDPATLAVVEEIKCVRRDERTAVFCACFNPDGSRLATAGQNGITVWDFSLKRDILSWICHRGGIICLDFSPDGALLLSGSVDHTLRVWNSDTGQQICTLYGHQEEVTAALFNFSALRIISSGLDGTVRFWECSPDYETKTNNLTIAGKSVALHPRGDIVAIGGVKQKISIVNFIEIARKGTLQSQRDFEAIFLSYNPLGDRLAACSAHGKMEMWDTTTNTHIFSLQQDSASKIHNISFGMWKDEQEIVATSGNIGFIIASANNGVVICADNKGPCFALFYRPSIVLL